MKTKLDGECEHASVAHIVLVTCLLLSFPLPPTLSPQPDFFKSFLLSSWKIQMCLPTWQEGGRGAREKWTKVTRAENQLFPGPSLRQGHACWTL